MYISGALNKLAFMEALLDASAAVNPVMYVTATAELDARKLSNLPACKAEYHDKTAVRHNDCGPGDCKLAKAKARIKLVPKITRSCDKAIKLSCVRNDCP